MSDTTKKPAANPEKERELIAFLTDRFETARGKLEETHNEIRYNREMYLNKKIRAYWQQDDNLTEDETRRVFRSSLVAAKIDVLTAIQTDNRPKIYINPETPPPDPDASTAPSDYSTLAHTLERIGGIQGLADTLSKIFDNWWDENRIDETLYNLVKEARICGAAVAKIWWNPALKNGRGDAVLERVPVEDFYPDPDASGIEDCRFCFHVKISDIDDIRRRYGAAADNIGADPDYSILHDGRDKNDEDDGLKYRIQKALVVESYIKDDTTIKVRDPKSNAEAEIPCYPNGRIITFCGGAVLRDESNPYPGFPFVKFTANPIPGSFFGKSDVRDLAPIQENADLIMQQILANMRLVGNAKIIYEEGALSDPDNLTNLIAERIPVTHMGGVNFIPPQAAAADGYAVYDRMLRLADDISGIYDVSQGRTPSTVHSGRAIISLQEGTNRRIRPSARIFEGFLKNAGEKILWLILKNYKRGRLYRFGKTRRNTATLPINLGDLDITFDIAIGPNSTLPSDRESKSNLALSLLNARGEDGLPIVDRQYVLEHLDLPGRDELMRRISLRKQAAILGLPPEATETLAATHDKPDKGK